MSLPSYAMGQRAFPDMYERWLVGPLFRPWAEHTLELMGLSAGDSVLDVACGTGIVARLARQRLGMRGRIVGIDISPDMLAVARALEPGVDWRRGDAAALPLGDGEQFDVVVCQQGLQFFADKAAAVGQLRRALAKGGRLAVTTWRSDEEIPFFRELRRIAERYLGPVEDRRYAFGDAAALEALLLDAGFLEVRTRTVALTMRFEDAAPFLHLNAMAIVGMSAAGKHMSEQERERVVALIAQESAPVRQAYAAGAGVAFELRANLATAKG